MAMLGYHCGSGASFSLKCSSMNPRDVTANRSNPSTNFTGGRRRAGYHQTTCSDFPYNQQELLGRLPARQNKTEKECKPSTDSIVPLTRADPIASRNDWKTNNVDDYAKAYTPSDKFEWG
jgi:hypothetical protein